MKLKKKQKTILITTLIIVLVLILLEIFGAIKLENLFTIGEQFTHALNNAYSHGAGGGGGL